MTQQEKRDHFARLQFIHGAFVRANDVREAYWAGRLSRSQAENSIRELRNDAPGWEVVFDMHFGEFTMG